MGMRRFTLLLVAAITLAGCGQKGPLYLPDKGGEVVTRPGGSAAQQPSAGQQQSSSSTDEAQKKKDQQQSPR